MSDEKETDKADKTEKKEDQKEKAPDGFVRCDIPENRKVYPDLTKQGYIIIDDDGEY